MTLSPIATMDDVPGITGPCAGKGWDQISTPSRMPVAVVVPAASSVTTTTVPSEVTVSSVIVEPAGPAHIHDPGEALIGAGCASNAAGCVGTVVVGAAAAAVVVGAGGAAWIVVGGGATVVVGAAAGVLLPRAKTTSPVTTAAVTATAPTPPAIKRELRAARVAPERS